MWIGMNRNLKQIVRQSMEEAMGSGEKSLKQLHDLRVEIRTLKEEKSDLEFKKNMEEKEIAHLVKMKEEKIKIETEKARLDMSKEFQKKEMDMQKDYFDKLMNSVKEGHKKMEEISAKILERLPNVNMEITRGRK